MKSSYLIFFLIFSIVAIGCSTASPDISNKELQEQKEEIINTVDYSKLIIKFPEAHEIKFLGKIKTDKENNGSNSILYPGGLAGLLAGVAVHSAVQSGVELERKKQEQEEANKVLEPYLDGLENISPEFFLNNLRPISIGQKNIRLYDQTHEVEDENQFYAYVSPVFHMTQNKQGMIVSNSLTIGESLTPKYKPKVVNTIYVISKADLNTKDDYWLKDDYVHLKEDVKNIFFSTIKLAVVKHLNSFDTKDEKQSTIRYLEDGSKKVERGYNLLETCERIVFESLRGEIKSAPTINKEEC